jgi:hypothetical protein
MSISMTQGNIERTQREIQSLNRRLTDETKKEADQTDRIIRAKEAISRTSSDSTIRSKLREIERYEREIGQIQRKKADLTRQVADKTAKLHSYQQHLMKDQSREQKQLLDSLKKQQLEAQRERESLLTRISRPLVADAVGAPLLPSVEHDAFISHASEDKEDLVQPLAIKLGQAGFDIWYDDLQLTVGDSLRRSIDKGLANSRFGIVVLSPSFFAKNWPQYELDGLVNREMSAGKKVILPIWHKVSKDEVRSYSPSLADKVALNTAVYTIDELVDQLSKVLKVAAA